MFILYIKSIERKEQALNFVVVTESRLKMLEMLQTVISDDTLLKISVFRRYKMSKEHRECVKDKSYVLINCILQIMSIIDIIENVPAPFDYLSGLEDKFLLEPFRKLFILLSFVFLDQNSTNTASEAFKYIKK